MTPKQKPLFKPAPSPYVKEHNRSEAKKRIVKEEAAARRDGWDGRSAALTAWQKNEAVMMRVDVLERIHREMVGLGNKLNWPSEIPMSYAEAINEILALRASPLMRVDVPEGL